MSQVLQVSSELKVVGYITDNLKVTANVQAGARGKSAYEIWLDLGNSGTPQDFLDSLGVDKHYVHTQNISSNEWVINHKLNKFPSVTVVDSADVIVLGEIQYIDKDNVKITFSSSFGGKAYLN